jgi:hypothetical protein
MWPPAGGVLAVGLLLVGVLAVGLLLVGVLAVGLLLVGVLAVGLLLVEGFCSVGGFLQLGLAASRGSRVTAVIDLGKWGLTWVRTGNEGYGDPRAGGRTGENTGSEDRRAVGFKIIREGAGRS